MDIIVNRLHDNGKSTLGTLSIDGKVECFTLEDTYNEPKVRGETYIPEGEYVVKLRNAGGMTQKYAARYPFHKGMLWLQDVHNFEWVYIHTGNTEEHTDGCILVGQGCTVGDTQAINQSVLAYSAIYPKIASAIIAGEDVYVTVV